MDMELDLEKGGSPFCDGDGGAARRADDFEGCHPRCTCGSGGVNSCYRHYTFGVRDTSVGGMFLVTLLFAVLAAVLLRRSHEPPPPPPLQRTVSVVWTVSLLVTSYLALWTYTLSRTMGAAAVFFRASYAAALACAAGVLAGPYAGMAAAHLCTAWAAGLLGYALAEHRLHVGREPAADEAAARAPSRLSEGHKLTAVHVVFVSSLMTLCLGGRAAWLAFFPSYGGENAHFMVAELSALVFAALYLWAMLVVFFFLREALVSLDSMMRLYFCYMVCSALGGLGMTVSHWIFVYCLGVEMMAMAALFGYMLAVNTRCKEILAREGRKQPGLADCRLGDDDCDEAAQEADHVAGRAAHEDPASSSTGEDDDLDDACCCY